MFRASRGTLLGLPRHLRASAMGNVLALYPSALKGGGIVGLWEAKDAIERWSKRSKNLDVNAREVI
jgi:hypothetical protein